MTNDQSKYDELHNVRFTKIGTLFTSTSSYHAYSCHCQPQNNNDKNNLRRNILRRMTTTIRFFLYTVSLFYGLTELYAGVFT